MSASNQTRSDFNLIENVPFFFLNVFYQSTPLSVIIHYKPNATSASSVLAEKQQKKAFLAFSGKLPQLRSTVTEFNI